MGSLGALPEQTQLYRCGQPLSQILSLSKAGSTRLACHGTCHLTLKPEAFEGQSEIQAETWVRPHRPPRCSWTASPMCWTAWAGASRAWLFHVFTHLTSAHQMSGEDWPCGHHQQISAPALFTQALASSHNLSFPTLSSSLLSYIYTEKYWSRYIFWNPADLDEHRHKINSSAYGLTTPLYGL